jgi:predicted transcriptional regulator
MSKSLTQGSYFLNIALKYFENFEFECMHEAKRKAKVWTSKMRWIENDVMCSITDKSREKFREEIKNGDTLFFQAINEKFITLSPVNRELVEKIIDRLISDEDKKLNPQIENNENN